ncbi:penicillin-binding transpeptidase domain-containing protein, partial [Virgisporangium aliadipatigenens]|uniref:penicillin-binding transpeptidase domain-containing protein n=1 Tax=Virgisporangium aliadipatigenens TaxID=741659 RepID=UPI0023B20DA0
GYKITSTLDIQAQVGAKKNIDDAMKNRQNEALMLAGTEPGTGNVRLLAVNRNYSNDQRNNGPHTDPAKAGKVKGNYPNTTVPLLTGGADIQGYQSGSVFKMFTMVAALEKGIPLDYSFDTPSPVKTKYPLAPGPAACNDDRGRSVYCPENSGGKGQGVKSMWTAFGSSTNTYFVPLQERVGADNVVAAAKKMGIVFHGDDKDLGDNPQAAALWGAFTLGVSIHTPLEVANAYATLAADGKYCKPKPIQEIVEISSGNKVDGAESKCEQVMSEDVARAATDAARCPVGDKSQYDKCSGGTATGTKSEYLKSWPIAGKTGTTDSEKSVTMEAFTKQLSVFGVHTDPDTPQTTKRFKHDQVNPTVAKTLRDAMQGKEAIQFGKPSQGLALGERRNIPNVKCKSIADARNAVQAAGFEAQIASGKVASECPDGTAAGTDPTGSSSKGSIVVIQVSNGQPPGPSPGPSGGTGGGGAAPPPPPPNNPTTPTDPRCRINPRLCD